MSGENDKGFLLICTCQQVAEIMEEILEPVTGETVDQVVVRLLEKGESAQAISLIRRVQEVFREELELDDLVLNDETTADDVEEWDSLSHVQLVVALEKAFGIKFTSREILSWDNVGDLVDCINKKL